METYNFDKTRDLNGNCAHHRCRHWQILHAQLHGNVLTNLHKQEKNLMLNYCKTSSRAVFV